MRTKACICLAIMSALMVFGCAGGDGDASGGDSGTDALSDVSEDRTGSETGKPDSGKPDSGKPDSGKPDSGNPDSGNPDSGNPDGGQDAEPDVELDAEPDVELDVKVDTESDVELDVMPDAPTRPLGQCNSNADCNTAMGVCSMAAPGGTCMGCGDFSECGDGNYWKWECLGGNCVRKCEIDTDCPVGFRCSGGTGRCVIIACKDKCPAPYVCSDGGSYCLRPKCEASGPVCPEGMTCGQENYCVEKK